MYRVRWKRSAINEGAQLWLDNPSLRKEITAAIHAIDKRLQSNPNDEGESRSNGRRIFFVPPLGVLFQVRDDRPEVRVLHIWKY